MFIFVFFLYLPFFRANGLGEMVEFNMASLLLSPQGSANDEILMEKNAGLIMGVCRSSYSRHLTLTH